MAAEPPQPKSLTKELERKLHETLAATPSVRAALEQMEPGDFAAKLSDEEIRVVLERVVWMLIEHSLRVSEEVDRLRGRANLDEEPST